MWPKWPGHKIFVCLQVGQTLPFSITQKRASLAFGYLGSRLTGNTQFLSPQTTAAEQQDATPIWRFDQQDNFTQNVTAASMVDWLFRRAPGFFDEVCYTGTGVARTVTHNLGVAPELMILKRRNSASAWAIYPLDATKVMEFDASGASATSITWNNTAPTASVFTLGVAEQVNQSGSTFVAYLFASCPGVSKVGSYTGNGTTQQINCGFTAGSRFVMIKRTDSTGDWYVWDSARGIVAGNDPFLLLNSTAAENTSTDYVDTFASGFEISSTAPAAINASGGSFIFWAIA
jgi:hypothetical protein